MAQPVTIAPAKLAPAPPKLPALPADDLFSEAHWSILLALLDASFPALVPKSESPSAATAAAGNRRNYLELPDAEVDAAYDRVVELCASAGPAPTKTAFRGLLADRASAHPDFPTNRRLVPHRLLHPIDQLPVHVRHKIVLAWRTSWIAPLRGFAKTLQQIAQKAYFQTSPLFQQLSTYSDVPAGYKPGPAFDFQFLQFPASDTDTVTAGATHTLETDVVIVGSGPGGSLPMPQATACAYMFEAQGIITSDDKSTSVLAGSCWGGGGTVNWSVALQTQEYVREEWARPEGEPGELAGAGAGAGMPFFTSDRFQGCLDRVCAAMGVSADGCRHNHANRTLLDSCAQLGWKARAAPQNTGGREHACGQCHLGCGSGEKMGPAVAYLPAAAAAGARFIEGFEVEKVLFEECAEEGKETKRAVGVGDEEGGDSGEEGDCVGGIVVESGDFEEEWFRGGIITSYCSEFENLDNAGHGVKLEPTCMVVSSPSLRMSRPLPYTSALEAKLSALKYRHMNSFISLTRDRDAGSVSVEPTTGQPSGIVALAKMCYVAGAAEIYAFVPWLEPFVRAAGSDATGADDEEPGEKKEHEKSSAPPSTAAAVQRMDADADFAAWLAELRARGNAPPMSVWTSAHQMGTCRMSADPSRGVVDPRGEVWGCDGLYVADASTFPSASGVNPMVTNMAISDYIASNVVEDLGRV
ncbi:unnamed protein product [Parascedosporium putredinis]|uniref:Long-chain-alcohol oxidase n=1 Tax=Parascedosporium putredinis TaxID=1442378 RepID=A0A9P1MDJ5_9PEZI|nr:unnamed protein product [Parascedosporium putredinis]CAI8003815.1 unnamed protein product [Parascedosporium putredinis]